MSEDGNTTSFLTAPKEEAEDGRWSPRGDEIVYVTREKEYFSGRLDLLKFDTQAGQVIGKPSSSILLRSIAVVDGPSEVLSGHPMASRLPQSCKIQVGTTSIFCPQKVASQNRLRTDLSRTESRRSHPIGKSIAFISNRGLLEANNLWIIPASGGEAHQGSEVRYSRYCLRPAVGAGQQEHLLQSPISRRNL